MTTAVDSQFFTVFGSVHAVSVICKGCEAVLVAAEDILEIGPDGVSVQSAMAKALSVLPDASMDSTRSAQMQRMGFLRPVVTHQLTCAKCKHEVGTGFDGFFDCDSLRPIAAILQPHFDRLLSLCSHTLCPAAASDAERSQRSQQVHSMLQKMTSLDVPFTDAQLVSLARSLQHPLNERSAPEVDPLHAAFFRFQGIRAMKDLPFNSATFPLYLRLLEQSDALRSKFALFCLHVMDIHGGDVAAARAERDKVHDAMLESVKCTETYSWMEHARVQDVEARFMRHLCADETLRSQLEQQKLPPERDLYKMHRDKGVFIAVDIRSANFTVLRMLDPVMVSGASSWNDFIGRFTDAAVLTSSKLLRQQLLGKLSPNLQLMLEKRIIAAMAFVLRDVTSAEIFAFSCDELIVCTTSEQWQSDLHRVERQLHERLPALDGNVRVSAFRLRSHEFHERPVESGVTPRVLRGFVRVDLNEDNKFELKGAQLNLKPQLHLVAERNLALWRS